MTNGLGDLQKLPIYPSCSTTSTDVEAIPEAMESASRTRGEFMYLKTDTIQNFHIRGNNKAPNGGNKNLRRI
jgi:hypothetical protein